MANGIDNKHPVEQSEHLLDIMSGWIVERFPLNN